MDQFLPECPGVPQCGQAGTSCYVCRRRQITASCHYCRQSWDGAVAPVSLICPECGQPLELEED